MPFGTHQRDHLGFHQCLGKNPNAFPQDVPVLLLPQLANDADRSILGSAIAASVPSSPAKENSRKDAGWPLVCLASAAYRISTTPRDFNRALT